MLFWIVFCILFVIGGVRQASTPAFQFADSTTKGYFFIANTVFSAFLASLVSWLFS